MAYFQIIFMVKRIPCKDYQEEFYTCDSVYQTEKDVQKKLEEDKDVIDFYKAM